MKKYLLAAILVAINSFLVPTYAITENTGNDKPHHKAQTYAFAIDRYYSPYSSAACIITTRTLFNTLGDHLIQPSWESSFWVRWPYLVTNNLVNDLLMLIQHEVSGHGFRQRSAGREVGGYSLSFIINNHPASLLIALVAPMNSLGGATHYKPINKKLSLDDKLLGCIAGNEANAVLANELILQNFKHRKLDYRDYNLFFKAFTNLLGYIILTSPDKQGDDIVAYLESMSRKYGSNKLVLEDLKNSSLLFYLNPVLHLSIISFYSYAFKKETTTFIPCLSFGRCAYMPIIRIGLTPFGIGYYLDNYLAYSKSTLLLTLQLGKIPGQQRYISGLSSKTADLYTYKKYTLDLKAGLFYQPTLVLNDATTASAHTPSHWAYMLGIQNRLQLTTCFAISGSVAYKNAGFMEGIVAQQGWMWEAGLSFSFPVEPIAEK